MHHYILYIMIYICIYIYYLYYITCSFQCLVSASRLSVLSKPASGGRHEQHDVIAGKADSPFARMSLAKLQPLQPQ